MREQSWKDARGWGEESTRDGVGTRDGVFLQVGTKGRGRKRAAPLKCESLKTMGNKKVQCRRNHIHDHGEVSMTKKIRRKDQIERIAKEKKIEVILCATKTLCKT